MSQSYCESAPGDPVHGHYHDTEYGFPASDEGELFERLVLEINQAGLSWATILRKRDNFQAAYDRFDVDTVAAYGDKDVARLLDDAGIIRNRKKVAAAIENAKQLIALRASHGGFHAWLQAHRPRPHVDWTKLFRQTFVFTGPLVVEEFLLSTGYLPGAHTSRCPVFAKVMKARPSWLEAGLEHEERA
ncbi:MAG: DNA-3-methyladenine glycosylase I [Alphaproteobacteria bacterium]|nr:DNA-3-methyladenine glycosylase I [Rhodospirillaceae bacterium]MBT7613817.1 DNA-3-methyladenine glycosylase I [Rhodospirillaceae bacterium]MBT7646191.1 DNA-3-methyladenine glycosylase I [Rhodospirillaceae bacterium]MDG2480391.1 DNA-3-methyladenine glycosylase I [Alphaproteobacteria bacterium]